MAEFCSARSNIISPLQWTSLSPPFTRIQHFEELASRQNKIIKLKDFIEMVKKNADKTDNNQVDLSWIVWAEEYVKYLDPFSSGFPKLLHLEDFNEWELRR